MDGKSLIELIKNPREDRSIDYKQSAHWNDLKFKITKTVMAMSNIRDGGTIIIGVEQNSTHNPIHFNIIGMDDNHISSYNEDHIQTFIGLYADPFVRFKIQNFKFETNNYLAIIVDQFFEIPVVCKKDGNETRVGAIYTRPYGKAESCEVRSQTEMREIIDLSIENGCKRFLEKLGKCCSVKDTEIPPTESDVELFEKQLKDLS